MGASGPDLDALLVRTLRRPMLNELMASMLMKAEMGAVANEIKQRYLAKLQPHRESGHLAATAKVTYHRSHIRDRRWEAEFSVGSASADYARPLEEKYHLLGQVLADMGFGGTVSGPTGRVRPEDKRPRRG